MNKNCLLCGVGGQGVVLASKLIANAALEKGLFVRTTETIGMAQRGGSVVSHVRIGSQIYSPLIPKGQADVILAFEPAEAVRNLPYLKKGGIVIVNQKAIKPVTETLGEDSYEGDQMLTYLREKVDHMYVIDGDEICRKAGSSKVLNVVLLGVAVETKVLQVSLEDVEKELEKQVNHKYLNINKKALALGRDVARHT